MKIRVVSERKLKKINRHQLSIRRNGFPIKFHQGLQWRRSRKSCNWHGEKLLSLHDRLKVMAQRNYNGTQHEPDRPLGAHVMAFQVP